MSTIRKGEALGWGPVTTVFRGWDELLDRPVAIKELTGSFADHAPFVRAFFLQAQRLADLAHPHVLATYSIEPNRRPPALYRELANETLAHQLVEGPLEVEEIPRLLRHVLAGLGAMHQRELLHRAIKPDNLFRVGDSYKIGDFGLLPIEGAPPVAPRHNRYIAPESGTEAEGPSSDLYSLGLTIYELVLGTANFQQMITGLIAARFDASEEGAESTADQVWKNFSESGATMLPPLHEVKAGLPVPLSAVLQKLVAASPGERYRNCREVEAALSSIGLIDTQALSVVPTSRTLLVTRPSTLWAAAVVMAIGLGGTALWQVQKRPAADQTSPTPQGVPAPISSLVSLEDSRGIGLEFKTSRRPVRVPIGTPLRFEARSDRRAYFVLFAEFSDGSIGCLYPGPDRAFAEIVAGRTLTLPTFEDEQNGFKLSASAPVGRDRIYLLTSDSPLQPPSGGNLNGWIIEYAVGLNGTPGPAAGFRSWVAEIRQREPQGTRLASLELEIVERP